MMMLYLQSQLNMLKRLLPLSLKCIPKGFIYPLSFSFSTVDKFANFRLVLQNQIKAESDVLPDLQMYEKDFKEAGWVRNILNTLVELQKKDKDQQIRLLSNIKAPLSFDHQSDPKDQQATKQEQMNEITICITREGSPKTMAIHTIVNKQHFQIIAITFSPTYQQAKNNRLDIQNPNQYGGPIIETLPQNLLETLGQYLRQLGITHQYLRYVGDYCFDNEQLFYINWLKDLKNTL